MKSKVIYLLKSNDIMISKQYKKRLMELSGTKQYVSSINAERAAEIASLWHGGMSSAFYSLASTKKFFPQLWSAYQRELKDSPLNPSNPEEMEMLEQLDNWLKAQAAKYSPEQLDGEDGHHMNDKMVDGYLKAAIFTAEDESLYKTHSTEDFSLGAINDAKKTVSDFKAKAGDLLDGLNPEQIGIDLYFTSNGHGTGFWDRDYADEQVRKQLTDLSHQYGERHCEVLDDGELGFMEI
jgi:hypothetical protein